jgi:SAM-dependent methyltransferase
MHSQFVNMLCSPDSGEPFHLVINDYWPNGKIRSGMLKTDSGITYPIIEGIPRFVNESYYASSFGYEWNKWPRVQFDSENERTKMAGHTTKMFNDISGLDNTNLSGNNIIEFGCGPGRFLDVIRKKNGKAIGIELTEAVKVAYNNFFDDPDVLIVQGDIFHPPFKNDYFDGGFSFGVLHHTPNPQQGVIELAKIIKPNGWVAISVYDKGGFYDFKSVKNFRKINNFLRPYLGHKPALFYSYFSGLVLTTLARIGNKMPFWRKLQKKIEQDFLVILPLPSLKWSILDTFDAITPEIASTHNQDEVRNWMLFAGINKINQTNWGPASLNGKKVAPKIG